MERKNTILLTVIAVATLLVAVVGASFAFFAVQETNTANVTVTTTTAEDSDVFSATGSGALSLTINNDVMQKATVSELEENAGVVAVSATDSNLKVNLTAGSGKATCTYKLTYTASEDAYVKSSGASNEYTLAGTSDAGEITETNMDAVSSFGPFTIEDTGAGTTQIWTFTTKFYNLNANQNAHLNKTYSGNIKVTDVVCRNTAN